MRLTPARVLALLAATTLSACAFTPLDTALTPSATVPSSTLGQGSKLYFSFVDDRDDTVIGHRGVGNNGAEITVPSLPDTVQTSLRNDLTNQGFTLTSNADGADASVTFRLRAFKFGLAQGFWSGEEDTAATLEVAAQRGARGYNQVYRFNDVTRIQVVPDEDGVKAKLNAALDGVLGKAYADQALNQFLAGK